MDLDVRKISVEYQADVADNSEPEDNYFSMSQRIVATYNGREIGYINFEHVEQEPPEDEDFQHENEGTSLEEIIYLSKIEVPEQYRGLGISGILYKKFGEVYSQKFMGLQVERHFENPIAEYSFKKAIDEGWVPAEAYSANRSTRDYNTPEKQQLWQDLRQKLPENLQANKRNQLFVLADNMDVDLRNLQIDYTVSEEDGFYEEAEERLEYEIEATLQDGTLVGSMTFFAMKNVQNPKNIHSRILGLKRISPGSNIIYVDQIYVDSKVRSAGIGQLLYKKFGEIYNQNYNGWIVSKYYVNPVAEYAFRKAVSLGWISESAISNNEGVYRDIYDKDGFSGLKVDKDKLWKDLRNKLPEQYQGPETWAVNNTNELEKFASESIDIRNGIDVEYNGSIGSSEYANGVQANVYMIVASLNGGEVGSIRFTEYKCDPNGDFAGRDKLHIDLIKVENQYQNLGIGQLLLKKFGEVYQNEFDRLPVSADFHNPIAEYSYRKAISLGWISGWALDDDKLKRNYDKQDKTMWKDLRKKIPPMYRG